LAPGVAAAIEGPSPSRRTNGNYAEYAYRIVEQGRARTVSGLWWDDAQTPIAAYLFGVLDGRRRGKLGADAQYLVPVRVRR